MNFSGSNVSNSKNWFTIQTTKQNTPNIWTKCEIVSALHMKEKF